MDLKDVFIIILDFTCIVLKLSEATNQSGGKKLVVAHHRFQTVAVVKKENSP
jgi:Na+/glutamate symporter